MLVSRGYEAAQEFLRDVREGRLDAAYASTTAAYRERTPRTEFDQLVAEHAIFRQLLAPAGATEHGGVVSLESVWSGAIRYQRPSLEYRAGTPQRLVKLVLVAEEDKPRVDRCLVDGD